MIIINRSFGFGIPVGMPAAPAPTKPGVDDPETEPWKPDVEPDYDPIPETEPDEEPTPIAPPSKPDEDEPVIPDEPEFDPEPEEEPLEEPIEIPGSPNTDPEKVPEKEEPATPPLPEKPEIPADPEFEPEKINPDEDEGDGDNNPGYCPIHTPAPPAPPPNDKSENNLKYLISNGKYKFLAI